MIEFLLSSYSRFIQFRVRLGPTLHLVDLALRSLIISASSSSDLPSSCAVCPEELSLCALGSWYPHWMMSLSMVI